MRVDDLQAGEILPAWTVFSSIAAAASSSTAG
jgi:hypothetical protein